MPEYQKAFIGPYKNGHMELKEGFYVPFNPAEITIEEAIGISDVPQASEAARTAWMRRGYALGSQYSPRDSLAERVKNMTRLSATLFFNTLYDLYQVSYEDVREDIRKLYLYTNTVEKYTAAVSSGRKPRVRTKTHEARQIYFFWGTVAVAGTLKQMSVNYTMFAPDGKPVRAQVGITIEGFYVGEERIVEKPASSKAAGGGETGLSGDLANWKDGYRGCSNPRKGLGTVENNLCI